MKYLLIGALLACGICAQQPSATMDDQRVVSLHKMGLTTDEMVRMINSAPDVHFDLSPAAMAALTDAGIPDDVIKAMAARMNGSSTSGTTVPPPVKHDGQATIPAAVPVKDNPATVPFDNPAAVPTNTPTQVPRDNRAVLPAHTPTELPTDVGVYYNAGDHWEDIMPEVVNWQTGGVIKSISTIGIVKGDVNGRIKKSSSRLRLSVPAELLVYCLEGVEITEYQLIHLRAHSDSREFRTVTGGVFHRSGGAKRDTLEFESSRVAKRTYMVKLPPLEAGEYGLLPPGLSMANSASAQLGKMYTFSVGK